MKICEFAMLIIVPCHSLVNQNFRWMSGAFHLRCGFDICVSLSVGIYSRSDYERFNEIYIVSDSRGDNFQRNRASNSYDRNNWFLASGSAVVFKFYSVEVQVSVDISGRIQVSGQVKTISGHKLVRGGDKAPHLGDKYNAIEFEFNSDSSIFLSFKIDTARFRYSLKID